MLTGTKRVDVANTFVYLENTHIHTCTQETHTKVEIRVNIDSFTKHMAANFDYTVRYVTSVTRVIPRNQCSCNFNSFVVIKLYTQNEHKEVKMSHIHLPVISYVSCSMLSCFFNKEHICLQTLQLLHFINEQLY